MHLINIQQKGKPVIGLDFDETPHYTCFRGYDCPFVDYIFAYEAV